MDAGVLLEAPVQDVVVQGAALNTGHVSTLNNHDDSFINYLCLYAQCCNCNKAQPLNTLKIEIETNDPLNVFFFVIKHDSACENS